MIISSSKLYSILLFSCMAGYIWLYVNLEANKTEVLPVEVCFLKHLTNIPCPSCGSTRSVISLIKGEFSNALWVNPLGFVVAIVIFLMPIWILIDIAIKKKTLFEFYQKMEIYLRRPKIAIPLIGLVIINWIWNITKGL